MRSPHTDVLVRSAEVPQLSYPSAMMADAYPSRGTTSIYVRATSMVNARTYGAGVITGLVSLSQGTCYWPDCEEPIVRFVEGRPVNNFETAHIRAANKGGRRYVEGMADEERNSFGNLVLLCLVHHKIVDKLQPDDFTIETLQNWKTIREAPGGGVARAA